MKKVALITGITGQDGSYLADFLLRKEYDVFGTTRKDSSEIWRFNYLNITEKVTLTTCNLTDPEAVTNLLKRVNPDEIYHLAAQSSVPESLHDPMSTLYFNILSTQNLINAIHKLKLQTRFFHASSSEIFSPEAKSPLTINSPIKPVNPYGIAKSTCHSLVQFYRNTHNMYAVNGILFPHESPLRDRNTILKFFISQAKAVKDGTSKKIFIASPENIRDIGDARSYVEAMWSSLQVEKADDYIICSGHQMSIGSLIRMILKEYDLPETYLEINEALVRQPNTAMIYGDPLETTQKIHWSSSITIEETIKSIIAFQDESKSNINDGVMT